MIERRIGRRYVSKSRIISLPHGTLHYGEDLYLNRNVIFYLAELEAGQSGAAYLQNLGRIAAFHHDHFFHILDTSIEENTVLIVLQAKPGKPFRDVWTLQKWTFTELIDMMADLGVSMLDAMEEQITGFSVDLHHLWLGEDHRLAVINYWDSGNAQAQGAIGLCRLLIMLLTGSSDIPGPFESLHTHLERATLKGASLEQKDAVVKLVKLVGEGKASLSSFVFGLRNLPVEARTGLSGAPTAAEQVPLAAPPRPKPEQPAASPIRPAADKPKPMPAPAPKVVAKPVPEEPDEADTEEKEGSRLFSWKITGSIGGGLLLAFIIVVWSLWPSGKPDKHAVVTPSPSATAVAELPTPSPTPVQKESTAPNAGASKEVLIPNLIGSKLEDAEQQALAAGLHYNYLLEANPGAKGTVIRQEPSAGTKGMTGDNVTFWVSKGAQ
ncbi:PASTA domain-containing protein [Paenibacillus aestuarii]|uniref:PASTA domain-containing protein n=1 Tax=Paenibacillus aestuarii TaxID=516965 RepID=A0ABW0KAK6_9BACL|nr:PASTA domain-containing protein [Paenibacillus aestuarii]